MPDREIAWAAGLYEGEGTCFAYVNKQGYATIRVRIGMTDEGPIRRFAAAVGCGVVNGPYTQKSRKEAKPMWFWQAEGWDRVEQLMGLLLPDLSERRKTQYRTALEVRGRTQMTIES